LDVVVVGSQSCNRKSKIGLSCIFNTMKVYEGTGTDVVLLPIPFFTFFFGVNISLQITASEFCQGCSKAAATTSTTGIRLQV
jgi:hypothetical protein